MSSVSRIVAVFPLNSTVTIQKFKEMLSQAGSGDWVLNEAETAASPTILTFRNKSQKCDFQFLLDPSFEYAGDTMWSMELLGVCDSVLLLTDYDLDVISPLVNPVSCLYSFETSIPYLILFFVTPSIGW